MKGRKPIPTQLKVLTGNPGKRPINLHTFAPKSKLLRCPSHLTGEARKEFNRLAKELHAYDMISEVDRNSLAMICTTWARYVECEKMIEKAAQGGGNGLFVKTPNGFPVMSPWLQTSNKQIELYKSLCAEFGMTPASRVRVTPQTSQLALPGLEQTEERPRLAQLIR